MKITLKLNDSPLPDPPHFSLQFFCIFFGRLDCVGHSFDYVTHFVFLGDVWIRTQRAAVASRCSTNLATHLPIVLVTHLPLATNLSKLATHLPKLATRLPLSRPSL